MTVGNKVSTQLTTGWLRMTLSKSGPTIWLTTIGSVIDSIPMAFCRRNGRVRLKQDINPVTVPSNTIYDIRIVRVKG